MNETPLQYHYDTYMLLTEKPIDPQDAIDEQINEEPLLLSYYSVDRQITSETLRKVSEEHEHSLAWTKLHLYQRPIRFSGSNRRQLELLEQRYNVKLPAAVREWYSLDIVPEIMTVRGIGPYHISELGPITENELFSRHNSDRSLQNLWYFLYDEYIGQGGEFITFRIDAGDDPPVVALGDNQIELAGHFSEFIYHHFWDWLGQYAFEYWFLIHDYPMANGPRIPERYHIPVERLRQEFSELKSKRNLRFYDEHCRIFAQAYALWKDDKLISLDHIITGGTFQADSIPALTNLIKRLWGDNAPVFLIDSSDPKYTEHIDLLRRDFLRRVLGEVNDWISADRLAPMLGASVPVLNLSMIVQINWLIDHSEIEAHPDNVHKLQPEHCFRLKQR